MKKFIVILVSTILISCAASGPLFVSHPEFDVSNSVLVYAYRPFSFVDGGGSPVVIVEGEKVGKLKPGGYLYKVLKIGKESRSLSVALSSWGFYKPLEAPIAQVSPGDIIYYKLLSPNANAGRKELSFQQESKDGAEEIKSMKASAILTKPST